uniref:4Fe-4S dicluster domain-containing protein n=1 Tax=Agathobaculum massiliense TaxID=3014267 RepID=UPI000D1DEEF5|nr:4Fe-4S dicluster domain-containing protein [Agathobaculum massiliense]
MPPFVRDIVLPMDRQQGDKLPASVFQKYGMLDGTWENGTSAYAKRGVATSVPKWDGAKCTQCNRCAAACPHAAIRPVLLTEEEKANVPALFETVPAKGLGKDAPAYFYRMQVSPYDCLGCGVCLTVCPVEGALTMTPFDEMKGEQAHFDETAMNESYLKKDVISDRNIKFLEFSKPYFRFSTACAGCAETTYLKMVSQLVGDRMYVGNAAGCSYAYSGVALEAVGSYLENWNDKRQSRAVTGALLAALAQCKQTEDVQYVMENKEYLAKKSVWAIGGDGWAYDIGFGGIDYVLAQNRDINLLVLDTEVYSNTGGQSSKATPTGAVAKFAAGGKQIAKKDLGAIFMNYGYIYIDFVPFTTGSKWRLDIRGSLKQALAAQGFKGATRGDMEWSQWIRSERERLAVVMERHGIEWEDKGTCLCWTTRKSRGQRKKI